MKHMTKAAAGLLAGCLLTGILYTAFPADALQENPTGSVTVTVYDEETGEPVSGNLNFMIAGATEALMKTERSFGCGSWNTNTVNPYTQEQFEIKPGWFYWVKLNSYNNAEYHYEIDTEKSQTDLDFTASNDLNLSVYVTKTPKTGLLICRGTFGAEQYPLFDYFYPDNYSTILREHNFVIYPGEFPQPLRYGDVYTAPPRMATQKTDTANIRQMSTETPLERCGNCTEGYETKTMTFAFINPSVDERPLTPEMNYTVSFGLEDESGKEYSYTACDYGITAPYSVTGAKLGDTAEFVMLNGIPLLPLNNPLHKPDIMGDVNEDRVLNLADVILLQKWLLGDPDAFIADWIAADCNKDGRLNSDDLACIKQALWADRARPVCKLKIVTSYGGHGVDGQDLGTGEFTQNFTVRANDWFYEDMQANWVMNTLDKYKYAGKLLTVESIGDDGVVITCPAMEDRSASEPERITVAYGEAFSLSSYIHIMDGYSYWHTIVFEKEPAADT